MNESTSKQLQEMLSRLRQGAVHAKSSQNDVRAAFKEINSTIVHINETLEANLSAERFAYYAHMLAALREMTDLLNDAVLAGWPSADISRDIAKQIQQMENALLREPLAGEHR